MYQRPLRNVVRLVCLGLITLAIVGCGESLGTVSGWVKVKGKAGYEPLPLGEITFISQGRKKGPYSGEIKGGKYTVTGVPAGKVSIIFQCLAAPTSAGLKDKDMDKSKEAPKPQGKGD